MGCLFLPAGQYISMSLYVSVFQKNTQLGAPVNILLIQFNWFLNSFTPLFGYEYLFVFLILGWKLYTFNPFCKETFIKFQPSTWGVQTWVSFVGSKNTGV